MFPQVQTTFRDALSQWLAVHSLGRKPRTGQFNREISKIILAHWKEPGQSPWMVTPDQVLEFGKLVAHYCPSRWNGCVSALRFISPTHGKLLSFRPLRIRHFTPPNQMQFSALLRECDAAPRSQAGLIVRFLCLTGLRISEARALTWENVLPDRIEVTPEVSKNGRARSIPRLDGLQEVLQRLRALGRGKHVLPRQNARKAIERACARAGVQRMSHHCFRHYFATRCIESGVDIPTVARWMGHQDGGALLAKTYFHLLDDHSRTMAARVKIAA